MTNPDVKRAASGVTSQTAVLTRLRPDVYDALVRQCPKPMLTPGQNDPQYAAYLLGVQSVLQLLREGYVAG